MKKAFTLIELVFAIVIIGIAVVAMPLLLLQSQGGNIFSLQQEAINTAQTKIATISGSFWDKNVMTEAQTNDVIAGTLSAIPDEYVLNIAGTGNDFNLISASFPQRVGFVVGHGRGVHPDTNRTVSTTTLGNDQWAMEDFNADTEAVNSTALVGDNDMVLRFTLTTNVGYISDDANYAGTTVNNFNLGAIGAAVSNIKVIEVNARNAISDKVSDEIDLTLRFYSFNIGRANYQSRAY